MTKNEKNRGSAAIIDVFCEFSRFLDLCFLHALSIPHGPEGARIFLGRLPTTFRFLSRRKEKELIPEIDFPRKVVFLARVIIY